ncbi:glycine--tRNA ligase, partial [Candidatus Woesearchaeota archaeon]|nr:glycine--tRNA ligase [Candidatus Woesearchaeota archaeon]
QLHAFISEKGFIWGPSPEIYGGMAGFYEYGPLGKLLKNRVENAIRNVFEKHDFWEVECPTVMPSKVWEASGHLGGFTDPLIKDTDGGVYRVDKMIEEWCSENDVDFNSLKVEGATHEHLLKVIEDNKIVPPNGKALVMEIKDHSLMMKTTVGTDIEAYNRPETATTTYLPFKNFDAFFRKKYPFSVFQIGKAYRNEISPRQSVMRGREFTQAEGQIFIFKDQKDNFEKFDLVKDNVLPFWFNTENEITEMTLGQAIEQGKLKNKAYAWTLNLSYELYLAMGIPKDRIRMRQHAQDEMAFYAEDAWDVEVNLNSYGWYELCGIHDRTDYDLTQHAKFSGQTLEAYNEEKKCKEVPHVLEIAFGTDRPTYALLDIFYDGEDADKKVFRVPRELAPVQLAVYPLMNKLNDKGLEVLNLLNSKFRCQYDKGGSIGKRYARADNIGIPLCVTVDFDTLENNDVTLRERDSGEQIRVKLDDLSNKISSFLTGSDFKSLE